MPRLRDCLVGLALAATIACATRPIELPVVATPQFPEFVQAHVPAALVGSPTARHHERAWVFLQAGDLPNADREIGEALKGAPTFAPAEADAGYLALARKDAQAALARFDRVLDRQPSDVSALVGKGLALVALDRGEEAVEAYQAALLVEPSLGNIARRVEVLRFLGLERSVAGARRAAQSGRSDEAIGAYRRAVASSPDSAFLYRELAEVERQRGDAEAALEHFRKAVALDPSDAGSFAHIAEVLEARGDLGGALSAYANALAVESDERLEARRDAVRARLELARLPEEVRSIATSPQLARGDLAALIGVHLAPLLQKIDPGDADVITDLRSHWAEAWILDVARAGIMEPFANHTFQPRAVVRRAEMAQIVTRLLSRAALPAAQVTAWQDARLRFPDVQPGHVAYPAASFAVASGILAAAPDGSFQPSRVVTGEEAQAAIDRLRSMNLPSGPRPVRP